MKNLDTENGVLPDVVVVLADIRSAHNVGAIFRTADAAGVGKVCLLGITPAPLDRFLRPRPDIAKAALGAERTVSWESKARLLPLLAKLKKDGYLLIAVEQGEGSLDYKTVKISKGQKAAFIFGNEVEGLPQKAIDACDILAEIPMRGMKESLNVSVAAGIALFRILDR